MRLNWRVCRVANSRIGESVVRPGNCPGAHRFARSGFADGEMDAQTKMSVLDRIGRGIPANKRLRLGLKRETRAVKGERRDALVSVARRNQGCGRE